VCAKAVGGSQPWQGAPKLHDPEELPWHGCAQAPKAGSVALNAP
jgi:hypothetical protein